MRGLLAVTSVLAASACVAPVPAERDLGVPVAGDSALAELFARVGAEVQVAPEVLAASSYVGARFRFVPAGLHAPGAGAAGLLGVPPDALARGARLAGVSPDDALTDPEASLRAGAAALFGPPPDAAVARTREELLATLPGHLRHDVAGVLARGIDGRDADGRRVVVGARLHVHPGYGVATQGLDYDGAEWIPASPSNYRVADRGAGDITHVVVHTMQGSYNGTISWFKNAAAQVSAHYVMRSSDGHIAQMVAEKDIAWHDRCFNNQTIGIEHEGYIDAPERWYTEATYAASARLTASICDRYGIAKEKGPIIGHDEAPDCSTHTDPGPGWDWAHYIELVRTGGAAHFDAGDAHVDAPASLVAGERATVTVTVLNRGNAAWDLDLTRLGTAAPQDRASRFFVAGDWVSPARATATDARVEPGAVGTFTFDVVAPEVVEPRVFDEVFQLVEEGDAATWFGPEIVVSMQVLPRRADDVGGCSAGGGSAGGACAMLALGAVLARRRRRR